MKSFAIICRLKFIYTINFRMRTLLTQPRTKRYSMGWRVLPVFLFALCNLVSLNSTAQTWTVGSGTSQFSTTATSPPSPLGYYSKTARFSYLYTAAEMTAAGMTAGLIHGIAFNVGSTNSATAPANYSLKMDNGPSGNLASTSWYASTVRFTSSTYTPIPGWNYIPLTPAYNWDGTSNVVIEICYDGVGLGTANAGVYYYGGSNNYAASGSSTVASGYCGNPSPTGANTSYKPNIQFTRLGPCPASVTAGTLTPSGTVTSTCPGTPVTIYSTGYSRSVFTKLTWQISTNGTTWTTIPGAKSDRYTTPPLTYSAYFRMIDSCLTDADTTAAVYFNMSGAGYPNYATLPYFEGFEGTWGNGCATGDKVASNNWTNLPASGDLSWRRDDDLTSAGWYSASYNGTGDKYEGNHSARFHAYGAWQMKRDQYGHLSLHVNTSGATGNVELRFWHKGDNYTYTADSLFVDMSYDSGANFTQIAQWGNPPDLLWHQEIVTGINTHSSPKTIFRFRAKCGNTSGPYYSDTYIDAVEIYPPCDNTPVAGTIDSVVACKGQLFKLKASGTSKAAGLSYTWQYKAPSAVFWTNLAGGAVASPSTSMTGATDYRLIVTCNNTTPTLSDTSAVYHATLAPFYYCYCGASQNPVYNPYNYVLVGNVTIATQPAFDTILYNGNPIPTTGNSSGGLFGYEDFRLTVPPPTLVRDSTYLIGVTQVAGPYASSFFTGMYGVAWIDFDRDGNFSNSSERILSKTVPSQNNNVAQSTFTVPTFAPVGLTGLRATVQYAYPSASSINPCGNSAAYGQYEDYLVKLEYTPCTGPSNAGLAIVSDSVVCPGYTIDLIDSTYEKQHTHISRYWQESLNGGASYAVLPGSKNLDIMYNVVLKASSKFRLMVVCDYSGDTTYSNAVAVNAPSPVHCYPVSTSALGVKDSSDIGSVIIGKFFNPDPATGAIVGPHLMNPLATKRHSDFTNLQPYVELWADSTYRLAIFQTMPRATHADALVSVFIDYNNNLNYEVTAPAPPSPFRSEMVYQGRTSATNFFIDTFFTVPDAVIANVPTGMRFILNNDLNMVPGNPALKGSGLFTSGEVEDYIVILKSAALKVPGLDLLQEVTLFPNPTDGKFTVMNDAKRSVKHMDVIVTTIAGQQVMSRSFDNVGTRFSETFDLGNQAKGMYFVEIHADGEKVTKKLTLR